MVFLPNNQLRAKRIVSSLIISNAVLKFMYKFLCGDTVSFLSDTYVGVELLDDMMTLF